MSVRLTLAALFAALALSACGLKGDPVRPGAEAPENESETESENEAED